MGPNEITDWIHKARAGDSAASTLLYGAIYGELRQLAARGRHGQPAGQVETTSLVHETYLRLAKPSELPISDRRHFFAVAARAMRQVLVDRARERGRDKRGGGVAPIPLEDVAGKIALTFDADETLAINEALERLIALDAWLAELVELRFFAGLTLEEIAVLSERSERSLKRDWRTARAFLHAQLEGG